MGKDSVQLEIAPLADTVLDSLDLTIQLLSTLRFASALLLGAKTLLFTPTQLSESLPSSRICSLVCAS